MTPRTVLVVDDEEGVCWALENLLSDSGLRTVAVATAERGLEKARAARPDLVLLDVRLPGMDGLAALEAFRRLDPTIPVVLMTAHGTVDTAIQSMARGAFDYLIKPLDSAEVRRVVERALAPVERSERVAELPAGPALGGPLAELAGDSPRMREVYKRIGMVAASDSAVLILGESGTGKELVARAIHQASARASAPFEPINCAQIPGELLESELYGHEKGSFTGAVRTKRGKFEIADGGTVLIDEVAEIPATIQVKLLRFLEDRKFTRVGGVEHLASDVRILAATHRNLPSMIEEGRFREDLYYRLNVISIELPPLRERPGDVPALVARFLARLGVERAGVSVEALAALEKYPWPGNVRELRNAIEHAAVLARGQTIGRAHLPEHVALARPGPPVRGDLDRIAAERVARALSGPASPGGLHEGLIDEWERPVLAAVMARFGGNQLRAAEVLGIHRTTLRNKLRRHGLLPGRTEEEA